MTSLSKFVFRRADYTKMNFKTQAYPVSISVRVISLGAGGRPWPPDPREPVPSVPPVGEADGTPLRYGGFRAASGAE